MNTAGTLFARDSGLASTTVEFCNYIVAQGLVEGVSVARAKAAASVDANIGLRDIWSASGLSGHDFATAVGAFFGLPVASLTELKAAEPLVDRFSPRYLREASLYPFLNDQRVATVAMADPTDGRALKSARLVLGDAFERAVAAFEDIAAALGHQAESAPATAGPDARADESLDNLRDLASGAPVVRAVDDLIDKAAELRASDIHLEPTRDGLAVRMRIDGLLRSVAAPADAPARALISRIKILSSLDIAERRLPQDGGARLRTTRGEFDIRVATMPTQHGESAVMRLLPRDRGQLDIVKLGMSARDESALRRFISEPHGLIVVTGPTGSGKTTTLATILSSLNAPHRKILTIEDPIEYELPGIAQSQVKPGIGLTFATAMRAFVRQDPDVIMVGEVRDAETAHIAIHAALTGHLVLTTLHTESAAAAAPRLIDLGVEPFLLKSTLRASIGQRLVRVLCERCKKPATLTSDALDSDPRLSALGFHAGDVVHEPGGCDRCSGIGYRGRIGVFEVMEAVGETREHIGPNAEGGAIDAAARRAGMTTMMDDAIAKCRRGMTSIAEAFRVTTLR